jgi:5-methylcytosine-specific restriction endonuclease McrBC GTP-binding regulatory subunit McrB
MNNLTKNISIKVLMKELNILSTEIIRLRNKVKIKHKKTVFTKEEADKIRQEFFKNKTIDTENKKEIERMNKDLNIIYYGPAGTGKTREALKKVEELTSENHNKPLLEKELQDLEEKFEEAKGRSATTLGNKIKKLKEDILALDEEKKTFYEFTTFHPSYQYQEFIEGITIRTEKQKTVYEIKDGIFKKLAKRAVENLDKNYVLIIDEINRGNISSIFGEFFTLLEDTKRVSSTEEENAEAVSITLPYSQEKLSVPDNLYILGTMNTTDKSISLLDVALRRRFKFIAVEPDYDILKNIDGLDVPKMLESINKRLAVLKGEDFQIGHSYFLNANNIEDLREIFEFKIIPLLKEYFHGDWESICAILNQDFKSITENGLLINKFTKENKLFKNNSKFYNLEEKKKIFKLNPKFSIDDLKTVI